jgi:hypothetical protein
MLTLQFGPLVPRVSQSGLQKWVGKWALHIQCPWQIERDDHVCARQSDLSVPDEAADEAIEKVRALFGCTGLPGTAPASVLVLQAYATDVPGGACIALSGALRLVIAPSGEQEEDWRLFSPVASAKHFVVEGGAMDPDALS